MTCTSLKTGKVLLANSRKTTVLTKDPNICHDEDKGASQLKKYYCINKRSKYMSWWRQRATVFKLTKINSPNPTQHKSELYLPKGPQMANQAYKGCCSELCTGTECNHFLWWGHFNLVVVITISLVFMFCRCCYLVGISSCQFLVVLWTQIPEWRDEEPTLLKSILTQEHSTNQPSLLELHLHMFQISW